MSDQFKNCLNLAELEKFCLKENREEVYPEIAGHLTNCVHCKNLYENIKEENEVLFKEPEPGEKKLSYLITEPLEEWQNTLIIKEQITTVSSDNRQQYQLKAAMSSTNAAMIHKKNIWSEDKDMLVKVFYDFIEKAARIFLVQNDPKNIRFIPCSCTPAFDFLISDNSGEVKVQVSQSDMDFVEKLTIAKPLATFVIEKFEDTEAKTYIYSEADSQLIKFSLSNIENSVLLKIIEKDYSLAGSNIKVVCGDCSNNIQIMPVIKEQAVLNLKSYIYPVTMKLFI